MRIALATANRDKAIELRALLDMPEVEIIGPHDGDPIDEPGDTLDENALIKARTVRDRTGMIALADDTGLFVRALGGKPGHRAARFAGEDATYADNVALLLHSLRDTPLAQRDAVFRSVIAIAAPSGAELLAYGAVRGRITFAPRGASGFGYDPVFLIPPLGRTFAEMSLEEKNVWSHRARAAVDARRLLRTIEGHGIL